MNCAEVTSMLVTVMYIVRDESCSSVVQHKTKWYFKIFTTKCDFLHLQIYLLN